MWGFPQCSLSRLLAAGWPHFCVILGPCENGSFRKGCYYPWMPADPLCNLLHGCDFRRWDLLHCALKLLHNHWLKNYLELEDHSVFTIDQPYFLLPMNLQHPLLFAIGSLVHPKILGIFYLASCPSVSPTFRCYFILQRQVSVAI
jgi:hypothetical protein